MSSTEVTNSDLSEKESNDSFTALNGKDQEVVQPDSKNEEEEIKDLESETIVKEQKVLNDNDDLNKEDSDNKDNNQKVKHDDNEQNVKHDDVNEQILKENEDQSTSSSTTTTTTTTINNNTITTTTAITTSTTNPITNTTTTTTPNTSSSVPRWSAVWDENAQAYYYWNTLTNETTWENPEDPNNINYNGYSAEYYDYYYSQYGYYPSGDGYYYGYDNSTLIAPSDTTVTTTEPSTNPLDTILDKIDKEVKSELDKYSSKSKKSSSSPPKNNINIIPHQDHDSSPKNVDKLENNNDQVENLNQNDQNDQNELQHSSSSNDLDSFYDQYKSNNNITSTTDDSDYQSFLAEHGDDEYKVTARFNARTGKFQRDPNLNPEKFSADSKAIRQMSYFFDYEQFAESRGSSASNKRLSSEASLGDSIRSPKKLNKKDIEMFKQKKKEKKDMKKKSWLLSDD